MRLGVERAVREVYAYHHVLLNAGFAPAEVFVSVELVENGTPPGVYAVVTILRGDARFAIAVSPLRQKDRQVFLAAWSSFSHRQTQMPRAVLDDMIAGTDALGRALSLYAELREKGFALDLSEAELPN